MNVSSLLRVRINLSLNSDNFENVPLICIRCRKKRHVAGTELIKAAVAALQF